MSQSNAASETNRDASKGRFVKTLLLAYALHTPLVLGERFDEVWSQKEDLAHMVKENAKGAIDKRTPEKEAYVKKLKEDLELGVLIDLGAFHLQTEYLEGRIDKDRLEKSAVILDATERVLRAYKGDKGILEVMEKIKESGPNGIMSHSYLSSALIDKQGNCHATQKHDSSLIHRLYPELKIVYQVVKRNGVLHTRTLVEVNGKWHSMDADEDVKVPMTDQDLQSTVLYEKYDEVKNYAGIRSEGRFIGVPIKEKTRMRIAFSDDFLYQPLPRGIWPSDIKDIAHNASVNAGGGLGQGTVGRIETAHQNQQGGAGAFSGNPNFAGPWKWSFSAPRMLKTTAKKLRRF